MASSRRAKLALGEELIGTVSTRGLRLTRETWRAQLAYRSEQRRAEHASRRGLIHWLAAGLGRGERDRPQVPTPFPRPRAKR